MNKSDVHFGLHVGKEDEVTAQEIARACNLRQLTARVLVARGIASVQEAQAFLTPSLDRDWQDPARVPGMLDVADTLQDAINAGKRILVFGDFDVDGVTATAISVHGLRSLGADAHGLIPHRYEEGYALSPAAIERAMSLSPDLIMTVDCGISCAQEVEDLLARGISVCITDHHEPGDHVPCGVPLTDPKLDPNCPSHDLAGAGVALKLINVLGQRMGKPELWREFTDLAALGTIADLMPLKGENRALVADGLTRIRNTPRPGILALSTECGVEPGDATSTRLSFSIIPRLNAAGRMGDATLAFDLLMSDDYIEAQSLAHQLEEINDLRRSTESELTTCVEERLSQSFDDEAVIVVAGEGWHEGVKGIVASRIARAYKRPAIIFSIEEGQARGSGRTYGDVNLFDLATSCNELFEKFGGHAAAVGITLPADRLDEFRKCICSKMAELSQEVPELGIQVDAIASVEECDVEGFGELELLQPFGNENPVPKLALKSVFLENRGAVGKQSNHFRYVASDGISQVSGIFFGPDDIEALLDCTAVCDIVFEPSVDEWRGKKTAKLMTKDILFNTHFEPASSEGMAGRIDELFEMQQEICETGEYAGITRAARFNTKVVGVTFEGRQEEIAKLDPDAELSLLRMPQNQYDPNAIAVMAKEGAQLGFLNKELALRIAPMMDEGIKYGAAVTAVTGGVQLEDGQTQSLGLNIVVWRADLDGMADESGRAEELELDKARERWGSLPKDQIEDALIKALIGQHTPHKAQREALDFLAEGLNTLAVMATGRGKSFIFHLHAARIALADGMASVFVYPLRALVADQAFHLQETFAQFGLRVCVLTGESSEATRNEVYDGLASGAVNCVLTTPEFLSIHAKRFAQSGRIGFVVVDEAHHVGLARAGNRIAYAGFGQTLEQLGNPLVLAVTATAGAHEAEVISRTLSIERTVLDPTVRENLRIDDRRDISARERYLANIVADGSKCVIYVNSRDQSLSLTRMLRKSVPALAPYVGFYNAGLSKADRKAIEDAFRAGELRCIVSTSAFGEGVNIPDIEHVVLYHLPFNDIEFNQMAGRAGRDGRDAVIHLLFGYGDARINQKILQAGAPPRDSLIALYRALKALSEQATAEGKDGFSCTNSELADRANKIDRNAKLDESGVSCGISVFRELGFLETSGASVARYIRLVPNPGHMDLEESVRYREGLEELDIFDRFRTWALKSQAQELLERFNRPILPTKANEA